MPTYPPYTTVASQPANARGERTILAQHIDQNLSAVTDVIEGLLLSLYASGGVVVPGTVTNPTATLVRVQGRAGITEDARGVVMVGNQSIDLAAVPTGTRCRVVIRAATGEVISLPFTDADTGEAIMHTMMAHLGRLELRQGDATNYPSPGPGDARVARVTRTAGGVTIDEIENSPASMNQAVIARGVVTAAGAWAGPSAMPGWTVARSAAGVYVVTHNIGSATAYAVSVSALATVPAMVVHTREANTFTVRTFNAAGAAGDSDFSFLLTRA